MNAQPDLIALAVVDEKGRVVIDGQMREAADIRRGDRLRMALVKSGTSWVISLTKEASQR